MRRDLTSSVIAIVVLTILLGLVYPLVFTGVAQVLFPGSANGSKVSVDGKVVGSKLIAQDFHGEAKYFQARPSQSGYSTTATFFSNAGPNSKGAKKFFASHLANYLKRERPYDPSLTASQVPVDAVTTSASGVDPQISQANADIQAHRVATVRHLPLGEVQKLIDDNTAGRALGLFGEPGVNVLELNLVLDRLGGSG
jgi:potassium-transporting ATPase KdpC subunit